VNVLIPMAGRGQRFADAGYDRPKPLIEVFGRPMYSWAVESLPLELATRVIFVALREHLVGGALEADIGSRYADHDPIVIPVDGVTEGQVCTVLLARDLIDDGTPLLVYNVDTYCRTALASTLRSLPPTVDGLLGVFEAEGDHWSFARVDECGRVVETAEKRRISPWATTGLYHFTRGADFVRYADEMVHADDRTRGEFYVAPLYNRMIRDGADIRIDVADEVRPIGTPDELARFEHDGPPA
jgi:NDP-sugar pyrophosphorylase family protein